VLAGQTLHDAPHAFGSSSPTHSPWHAWKPVAHCTPHSPPTQVAVALGGTGHGAQRWPHEAGESFETHAAPQA